MARPRALATSVGAGPPSENAAERQRVALTPPGVAANIAAMSSLLRSALALSIALPLLAGCSSKKQVKVQTVAEEEGAEGVKERKNANEVVKEYDLNHDGKTDVWKYFQKGADGQLKLVRKELDINWDGHVDVWKYYDDKEQLAKEALDLDYDGHIDQVTYFENGQPVRKEKDLDYKGKPDLWIYYEKGQIARKERDTKGTGKVDYWEYWANGQPDRIGEDLDGDGSVDRWTKVESGQ